MSWLADMQEPASQSLGPHAIAAADDDAGVSGGSVLWAGGPCRLLHCAIHWQVCLHRLHEMNSLSQGPRRFQRARLQRGPWVQALEPLPAEPFSLSAAPPPSP